MKAHHTVLTAMLLGGLVFSAPALADQPPVDMAVDDSELPSDAISAADNVPATPEDMIAAKAAWMGEDLGLVAPEWEHWVPITTELLPGPNADPAGDKVLRLVQRSTTGKVVGAQVGLALLTRTAGGSTFGKGQLKGTRIDSIPHPAYASIPDQVRLSLNEYFKAHPGAVPTDTRPVQATAGEFSLIYQELGDSDTLYELRQNVSVGFPLRRRLLGVSGGEGAHCSVAEPVSAPLAAWQADDYALVRETAQRYVDDCMASFVAKLPELFPDRAGATATDSAFDVPAGVPIDYATDATDARRHRRVMEADADADVDAETDVAAPADTHA